MADTDLKDPNVALPVKLVGAGANGATDSFADVDLFGNLKTMTPTKLVGEVFEQSTLDALVWSSTVSGSGTLTLSNGVVQLQTGTTANSSSFLASMHKGRYFPETINAAILSVRLGDTGTANNVKRWGAYDANNGVFFQLNGSTFGVGIRSAGSDTIITSFNGIASPTVDTNFHRYEIQYSHGRAAFFQDGNLIHTYVATATALAAVASFYIGAESTNSGGGTTNASLFIRDATIMRYGQANARERFFHSNFVGRVQFTSGTSSGAVNSFAVTLPNSSTAGNCLIAAISVDTQTVSSVTDNKGQTWTQAAALSLPTSGHIYMYYVPNSLAGVTTITVTLGVLTTSAMCVVAAEYFGVNSATPLDQTSTNSQTTNVTAVTSGSTATTSQAIELLFGMHYTRQAASDAMTPGTGWTSITATGGNGDQMYAQDQIVTATGAYASTATAATAHQFFSAIGTFKMTIPANAALTNFPQVIKTGAGTLRRVIVNTIGSSGATLTLYDGTSTSGTEIASISLASAIGEVEYDLDFDNGLTIVVSSTAPDFTILYD